ncbi:MAG: AAA family ATPase [Candidatus Limivivens sp.]|nr:AAA family ATPase [Candidatus Limivivens sp.]
MGRFLNPDNRAFQVALNSEIYIDKTELLAYTNKVIDTKQCLICNSRPRRFGKSVTVDMLTAYYSKGCHSEQMFSNLKISKDPTYKKHLNQYDVSHFDVQWCMDPPGSPKNVVSYIKSSIIHELQEAYPGILPKEILSLSDTLSCINAAVGKKFIILIDEWDVLIRDEASNQEIQEEYINFLRGLFKCSREWISCGTSVQIPHDISSALIRDNWSDTRGRVGISTLPRAISMKAGIWFPFPEKLCSYPFPLLICIKSNTVNNFLRFQIIYQDMNSP